MSGSPHTTPPHYIVIVPGIMGSKLVDTATGELVWVDFSTLGWNPLSWNAWLEHMLDTLRYPNSQLQPSAIMDEVLFIPPWAKQEQYSRLVDALETMGYRTNPLQYNESELDVYTFPYDWRQDNRISARQLGQAIARWQAYHPNAKAWIIGHSMGGLLARWYIEKEGGKDYVGRLFLMGSPWDGSPKAMNMLWTGFETFFRRLFNVFNIGPRTREVLRTFPSIYQLLPYKTPFLRDTTNRPIDLYAATGWLDDDQQRQMLLDGRAFNQELGNTLSVETLCFFGIKRPTTTAGLIRTIAQGRWNEIVWEQKEAGDGTVPEQSAVHANAREKLPFAATHGDIYVNPAVLDKLEWELIRRYQGITLAEVTTESLRIMFEPDRDVYSPGELVRLWATVENLETALPILGVRIGVQLLWRQALPGITVDLPPDQLPSIELEASPETSGRYEGSFISPSTEGYYRLVATVEAPDMSAISLEELILVELEPRDDRLTTSVGAYGDEQPSLDDEADKAMQTGNGGIGGATRGGTLSDLDETDMDELEPEFTWDDSRRRFEEERRETTISPSRPASPTGPSAASRQPDRWINAEILDHDPQLPLTVGVECTLAFDVDIVARPQAATIVLNEARAFAQDEDLIELQVFLSSKDFAILTPEPQTMRIPRVGESKNKARFDIEPLREGIGEITAVLFKNNNFVQDMILKVRVGGEEASVFASVESLGRPPHGISALQARDVSLIIKSATQGFDVIMVGASGVEATLPHSLAQLDNLIADVRQTLQDIVYLGIGPSGVQVYSRGVRVPRDVRLVYQSGISIPEEVHKEALRRLAEAGWLLYQKIFYAPDANPSANQLGDELRKLALGESLKIQIVSQRFMLPWGALYMSADPPTADTINPELFLGFKHIIEHIPLQPWMAGQDLRIKSQPRLAVGINVDEGIDQQMGITVVSEQLAFWEKVRQGGTHVSVRKTDQEVIQSLANTATPDQILYFYCHAVSNQASDRSSNGSYLGLSGKKRVTLNDLMLRAPMTKAFAGAPLIFINACESAELSPSFYEGFMPYFTRKGARGLIGTECETPAVFAAEWARCFFEAFLSGNKSLGQIFLQLRREFFFNHNNLLGLTYALYCDGDTEVVPGLRLS